MIDKPDWWPTNPYPARIFTMGQAQYEALLPDPVTRTAVSGMLAREFWELAAEAIWEAWQHHDQARMTQIDGALLAAAARIGHSGDVSYPTILRMLHEEFHQRELAS